MCLKDINKGAMAERFIDLLTARHGQPLDFVLCAGDDSSDELMVRTSQSGSQEGSQSVGQSV